MFLLIDKKANPIFRVDVLSRNNMYNIFKYVLMLCDILLTQKFDGEDGTSTIDVWIRLYYPGNTIALQQGNVATLWEVHQIDARCIIETFFVDEQRVVSGVETWCYNML